MGSVRKSDFIRIAKSYIGYKESGENITIFSEEMDKINYFVRCGSSQGKPWCATFTNYCFVKSSDQCKGGVGGELTQAAKWDSINFQFQNSYCNKSRTTGYYADYFMAGDNWSGDPQIGDIVFINVNGSIGHVGIVTDVGKYITTVEGNAGDMVQERYYDFSDIDYYNGKIAGFGRPYFDDEPIENSKPEKTFDELIDDLAHDCIEGKYGNYPLRKQRINALGHGNIYSYVQKRVNQLLYR